MNRSCNRQSSQSLDVVNTALSCEFASRTDVMCLSIFNGYRSLLGTETISCIRLVPFVKNKEEHQYLMEAEEQYEAAMMKKNSSKDDDALIELPSELPVPGSPPSASNSIPKGERVSREKKGKVILLQLGKENSTTYLENLECLVLGFPQGTHLGN